MTRAVSDRWRPLDLLAGIRTGLGGDGERDRAPNDFLDRLPGPALLAVVAGVYLALSQLVILLNDPVQLGAGFWPAAGLSLGLLLLLEPRRWLWVLAGVAIAETVGDLLHGYEPAAIVFWTAGNTLEPLVGALLIRRFSPDPRSLAPVSALLFFVALGVVAGPLVGATIGSIGTIFVYERPAGLVWPRYVIGDALGVLVVAPVLLTWRTQVPSRSRGEALLLAVAATVVTLLVFRNWDVVWDVTLPYLIVPILMWAGLRFGLKGLALTALLVANIANASTAFGYGPFAITGGTEQGVTLLQVFLAITLTTSLVLASLATDLTDSREDVRRQAEHAVEVQRNREFRDAFLGVLSHEIRSPITTIYGMSLLLRKRHAAMGPDEVGQYLDDIGAESDRLRRLTEDLLVLSRAQGGRLTLATSPVVLPHLVRGAVDAERTTSSGHDITLENPDPVPLVLGEEVYIEQVVRNFLNNAIKYSAPGSVVRVTVASEDGGACVRVIDEGPGLPTDGADRLFEPFYRSPDAIGKGSGAGIGLFVCRELIRAMGGRVWAAPGPGSRGAEFGFWLPAAGDEDSRPT